MTDTHPRSSGVVWLNGKFVEAEEAVVSVFDRGFLYGDGLFETMRAEGGRVLFLREHMERMRDSAEELRIRWDASIDWGGIFRRLLERNDLMETVAVAKAILTRGVAAGLGLPDGTAATLCLTAQAYNPPNPASYENGWRLVFFRQGASPPLSRHKSLNYLYHMTARQYALDAGADEAVILDWKGRVCETAAGSLLIRTGAEWIAPDSSLQLKGTTAAAVVGILREQGELVTRRECGPEDLLSADTVWALNSLMGVMPVASIENRAVRNPAADEASDLRATLFRMG